MFHCEVFNFPLLFRSKGTVLKQVWPDFYSPLDLKFEWQKLTHYTSKVLYTKVTLLTSVKGTKIISRSVNIKLDDVCAAVFY